MLAQARQREVTPQPQRPIPLIPKTQINLGAESQKNSHQPQMKTEQVGAFGFFGQLLKKKLNSLWIHSFHACKLADSGLCQFYRSVSTLRMAFSHMLVFVHVYVSVGICPKDSYGQVSPVILYGSVFSYCLGQFLVWSLSRHGI